jgi:hypothetical protein
MSMAWRISSRPPTNAHSHQLNIPRAIAFAASAWTATGHAAGGHFAVDDATILDPGQCQVEVWREGADHVGSVWHVGPACRAGPVELTVNADRVQGRDRATQTLLGPQIKWALPIDDRLSIGLVVAAAWRDATADYVGATVYVPLSVQLAESLRAHVNVGRDWFHDGPTRARAGIAVEWQATPAWALVGERFRQLGGDFVRVGVHWQAEDAIGFDLSRARGLGAAAAGGWAIGVSWAFSGPVAATGAR